MTLKEFLSEVAKIAEYADPDSQVFINGECVDSLMLQIDKALVEKRRSSNYTILEIDSSSLDDFHICVNRHTPLKRPIRYIYC